MKVYFDQQVFFLQKYGGISKYFVELARALKRIPGCDPSIVTPSHDNEHLREVSENEGILYRMPLRKLINSLEEDKKISAADFLLRRKAGKSDILHETYFSHRVPVKAKKVITIHDMIFELFHHNHPGEQAFIAQKKKAIMEADAIIAVSENTKRDLLKFYPEVEPKVNVVLHGVLPVDINSVKPYHHTKPFILFVGNRNWYKNFDTLLEVYGGEQSIHSQFDLICCGGTEKTEHEQISLEKFKITDKVHFLKGSDELVNSLYKGASALAYVSAYEGFGLPVLEAMRFGCPVLCSDKSSLPEVAGDAALMIDPGNTNSLTEGLKKILFNEEERNRLKIQGIQQAAKFTWDECASNTYKVYSQLLK